MIQSVQKSEFGWTPRTPLRNTNIGHDSTMKSTPSLRTMRVASMFKAKEERKNGIEALATEPATLPALDTVYEGQINFEGNENQSADLQQMGVTFG